MVYVNIELDQFSPSLMYWDGHYVKTQKMWSAKTCALFPNNVGIIPAANFLCSLS